MLSKLHYYLGRKVTILWLFNDYRAGGSASVSVETAAASGLPDAFDARELSSFDARTGRSACLKEIKTVGTLQKHISSEDYPFDGLNYGLYVDWSQCALK